MAATINPSNPISVFAESSDSSAFTDIKGSFLEWLSNGNSRKFSPQASLACLDRISEYVINKKISCSIWEITKPSIFKPIQQKVLSAKLLKIMERNTYKAFIIVGELYMKFLKEKPWKKTIEALDESKPFHMESTYIEALSDINPEDVIAWLITQPNAYGTLYLENVVRQYMGALRTAPAKLRVAGRSQ